MKKEIIIQIDETLLDDLDNYSDELNITRSCIIEKALNSYFDILEEMISDHRIDEVKKGKVKVYSLEEVVKELGIN